ncbi:3'-5' exonuclease [Streptacidiphilus sp. ASG 303]|uniref:3'-5' exonuclease n=1 Tax=Streptacidiphilus sp. ASG 303 TaxID=2896847 RepID=UPI001E51278B|nr:3'-5' exonuclease [Streptacidiphilus sp. ASG 303]MCD0485212.1 3'-5' exonuclease [Streptacidiphilus sp. ASG 303]
MTPSTWPHVVVADVEGNGASPPDLIEVATVPVTADAVLHEQARQWLVRPPTPIRQRVTRIHGITDTQVATCPAWPEVADQVRAALDGAWLVAHSAKVDYDALTRHLPGWKPVGVIDTLRLARATWPDAPGHGLDALVTHAHLDTSGLPGQRHRASFDAGATALLLQALARSYATWDALAASAVPPGLPGHPSPSEEPTLW